MTPGTRAHATGQPTLAELERDWRNWHAARERELATETGWLTLTWFSWLGHEPAAIADLPGRWSTHDGSAVVRAQPDDGLTVDGEPVQGAAEATVSEGASLHWVHHGRRLIELVRRGGRYAVRLRDPHAPARTHFTGVPAFPVRAEWVVPARFVAFDEARDVEVSTARDDLRQVVRAVGTVTLERDGTAYDLVATSGPVGTLTLLFHDATNGVETADWRAVALGATERDGEVVVDFNRSVNLPFAFSDHGTCPAPIEGNAMPFAVTAGEKAPR